MKKSLAALVPVLCFAALSLSSVMVKADTLTLVSASATSGGEYIYPYNFSLNGSPSTIGLMCMDLNREITFNETWNVTKVSVTASKQYEEEAYIFSQVGGGTYSNSDVQWAAWSIFDAPDVASDGMNSTNVQNLLAAANTAVTTGLPASFYSGYVLYIPTSDTTGWTAGNPQEFIGKVSPVPEPSSLMLFGSGLLGLATAMHRRMAQAAVRVKANC